MPAEMAKDIYELGEIPDLGVVPPLMHAQLIRESRFGEPKDAFKIEQIPVPDIGPREVLVYVMAAGVNYNNVWAALGIPINVIKGRQKKGEKEDFHIGGSDASGIVWKIGKDVKNVKVGDEVVVHCGWWDHDDPHVMAGKDPMFAPSQLIWGYETNWGSFAQFTKVQDHMCLPKPPQLPWKTRRRTCSSAPRRTECCTAGHRTSSSPAIRFWFGAAPVDSAPWRFRSFGPPAGVRWPS
jgi:crotonyl-CoA carboxylase/reductase